jgi:hypothetical protein
VSPAVAREHHRCAKIARDSQAAHRFLAERKGRGITAEKRRLHVARSECAEVIADAIEAEGSKAAKEP